MVTTAELRRLIIAHQGQTERVRKSTLALIERTWVGLGEYRDPQIATFAAAAEKIVTAGQRQMAMLTAANIAATETLVTGEAARPVSISPKDITTSALRGVPSRTVYTRPGVTVWDALSKQVSVDEAIRRGLGRALNIAATDLQLAKTHTAQRAIAGGGGRIVGYRRVLTGNENCGLCAVASTQRYHRGDLMPIHPGCDCQPEPIWGDVDPGQVINQERLDATHQAILDTFGAADAGARDIPGVTKPGSVDPLQYRDVIVVHQHGEIGPVLGVRGQRFTGQDDI